MRLTECSRDASDGAKPMTPPVDLLTPTDHRATNASPSSANRIESRPSPGLGAVTTIGVRRPVHQHRLPAGGAGGAKVIFQVVADQQHFLGLDAQLLGDRRKEFGLWLAPADA